MNPRNHEERTRHNFDSYCKKIMKRTAIDIQRHTLWRSKHEINISEMSAQELAELAVTDNYFMNEYVFDVLGESVGVSDSDLAEALKTLPEYKRDIIFMSYFFDMTDEEIALLLNMARRTVAYQRTNSLKKLKQILESEE